MVRLLRPYYPIVLTRIMHNTDAAQNHPQGRMGAPPEGGSGVKKVSVFFILLSTLR